MADRTGQHLGNYHLVRLLGQGSFAEVYLGEHVHLGTEAAIKLLHTELAEEDTGTFRREARTIARLVHPHIVRVFDFGIEGETPFLVMDYAPNGTLRKRHPKGVALPFPTILSYVKQVADALQYAHDEHFIHRDIKPENLLVGRRQEVLLSDFGIATLAQSSRYQNTQDMAGTMAYIAPEQIQGKPRPASDQYSLAIVVYEWLSGERPFHGSFTEMVGQHLSVPPPPLREKDPTISLDVEQVVMTALSKEPKERFASVQAFAIALEQASKSEQSLFLAPTVRVKPPEPTVQPPLRTVPSKPPAGSPVSPPPPPKQSEVRTLPVGTTLYTYGGHSGTVNTVAWSPDGTRIASGGDDKTVQVWNATTGRNIFTYHGHSARVNTLTWSPDGRNITSGSDDQTVQMWETFTNRKVFSSRVHSGWWVWVRTVAWSPDGKCIASGSIDGTVQIWDAASGNKVFTYDNHSSAVVTLAWSPDSTYIASGSDDKTVQVWQAKTGSRTLTYSNHSSTVFTVGWSPNGKYIASGSYDKTVQVWEATTGAMVFTYDGHSGCTNAAIWSPDGNHIASGSSDGTVQVWDATTGQHSFTYGGHSGTVNTVAWSPDGTYIASGGDDKTVQVWQAL